MYNEIIKYSTVDQLLSPYDNVIILLECAQDFGRWICLKKIGNVISFFDSYGNFPDDQKVFVNTKFLKYSGQKFNVICKLLDEASYKYVVEFSDQRLQTMDDMSIATCGHWCVVYIKSGMLIEGFYNYIESFNEPEVVIYTHSGPEKTQKRCIHPGSGVNEPL